MVDRLIQHWDGELGLRARWARLPRDARDTLFQLVVIGWTLLPHAAHLPPWCSVLALALLLWRGRLALRGQPLPARGIVLVVLVLAVGLTLWSEGSLLGRDAGVTLLVMLMALKTLELRAKRDAMVVFFLGFFVVLTNFLYSQSLAVAASMLVSVCGLLTALVLAHMPVGRPSLAQAARLAARAALLGLPLMVVLFALFPRLAPLWGVPHDAAGRTGLSGSLRMGGVAEIANDDTVAMRVRFFGAVPSPERLYFRGPVLANFDGREWTRLLPIFPPRPSTVFAVAGAGLPYELTIEPSRLAFLPVLDLTPFRPEAPLELDGYQIVLRADGQWQLDRPLTERVRLQLLAWPGTRPGPRTDLRSTREHLALPPGYNPRALAWAAALRDRLEAEGAGPQQLAQALLDHVRTEAFTYTLEPGTYGRDAVDEFWFGRKLGFCEHFAASFVVMMRAMGVPARIVTGYQGTDVEPVDGYYIVRQSHAHAWAEFWVDGQGWIHADPTAAVAPERVRSSRPLQPERGLVAQAIDRVSPQATRELRALWEALDNRWNQWVLNYSRGQQFNLLRRLGFDTPSWNDLATVLAALLGGVTTAVAGWALWDRHRQDPWQRLQRRVRERLGALGVAVADHEPPRTRAERVRTALGERGVPLARSLEALDRQRYGRSGTASGRMALLRWWRAFTRLAAHTRPG